MQVFLAMLLLSQNIYATTNSISNDILNPNNTAYDITFTDDTANKIYINKTYIEVSQVVKEIEKIANALVPRDIELANCSSSTGCPIDSVQCDAVTESPYCPDGSTLNTVRDMCQKNPDVFACPDGFTYDKDLKQCVKPLDCPNGGTYSIERQRCEYKRIYECPTGYTQSGDTCIAPPTCPTGATFDATLLKCTVDATYACADSGWTYDPSANKCWIAPPTCPTGMSYNSTYKMCILAYTPTCASGYTYNTTRDRCEKTPPDCPAGTTYNATTNRCEQGANSACSSVGGTWNGTNCTIGSNYAATGTTIPINTICGSASSGYLIIPNGFSIDHVSGGNAGTFSKTTCPYFYNGSFISTDCYSGSYSSSGQIYTLDFYPIDGFYSNPKPKTTLLSQICVYYGGNTVYSCPSGGTLSGTTCNNTTTVAPSCPTGYTHDGSGKCYANPTCPSSGSFDGANDVCWLDFGKSCTIGTYDATSNACVSTPTCTKGIFNTTLDRCEQDYQPLCGTGWTFNSTTSMCEKNPVCIVGTYNKTLDKCVSSYAKNCPSGFTLNTTTNRCEASPNCTSRTTYNETTNVCESTPLCSQGSYSSTFKKCILSYSPTCASGYTYVAARDRCEKTPDCPSDTTYNATTNRCEQGANSACASVSGTWNGTNCTIGSNYAATAKYLSCAYTINAIILEHNISSYTNTMSIGQEKEIYLCWSPTGVCAPPPAGTPGFRTIACLDNGVFSVYSKTDSSVSITYYMPGENFTVFVPYKNVSTPTYTCPSGGTLSGTTCINQTTVAASCPAGYAADTTGKCYANPTCPSSGSFDGNLDVCWLAYSKSCPAGMSYDSVSNSCLANPTCTAGTLNTTNNKCGISATCLSGALLDTSADKCALAFTKECNSGTIYDSTNDLCTLAATCDGGTLNTTLDKCQIARDVVCATGTKDPASGKCTFTATCQAGATLLSNGCNTNDVPLTCKSGTDTTLDVCYSDVDACKINSSYPVNLTSTLVYSTSLKTCLIDENVVCASSLTWSASYQKCEAVPICYNGMYNPENDFCYIKTKECPINASYPCKGPIGNQWCSPYECNPTTNQCGYAECPGGLQPSLTAEMSPSYNANLIPNASDTLCTNSYCDIANSSRFTYCGLEAACPSGFGVYEQNGQCFVRECPQDSFQENNKCYSLGCPKGTTEQGSSKCLVN